MSSRFAISVTFLTLLPIYASAVEFSRHTVECVDRKTEYRSFAPAPSTGEPLPVLLLLHGAGDEAPNFIAAWEPLAKKKRIILLAPQLPRELSFEAAAPKVFRCIVDDAKKQMRIDPQRIYIFGYSMGGYLAYDGALLESKYFAAAAIFAMGIDNDYVSIVKRAERKIPIAIYTGTDDHLVSLKQVRKTKELLEDAGFPGRYREIGGHGHSYYDISEQINTDAWEFLSQYRLP